MKVSATILLTLALLLATISRVSCAAVGGGTGGAFGFSTGAIGGGVAGTGIKPVGGVAGFGGGGGWSPFTGPVGGFVPFAFPFFGRR